MKTDKPQTDAPPKRAHMLTIGIPLDNLKGWQYGGIAWAAVKMIEITAVDFYPTPCKKT